MENLFIKNRQGNKIVVNLSKSNNQTGLVFVMPGLGNIKEEQQQQ